MLFKNGLVFMENGTFEKVDVRTKDDKIIEVGPSLPANGEEVKDISGKRLIPGLVDIHSHGCGGADFCDGTQEALQTMADTYLKAGVTTTLGTSTTVQPDTLRKIFRNYGEFVKKQTHGARMIGVNMEGPFLSVKKRGAHILEYLLPADFELFTELNELSGGRIRQVDLAPEIENGMDFIRKASKVCTVCVAHTTAGYEQTLAAYEAGATSNTHMYNAMVGLSHREPGTVGAIYDSDTYAELICDGFHIHPAVIRATFKILGKDRICLISDSMRAAGCPNGTYELGEQDVFVKDGKAVLADDTIAGSIINVHTAVQRVISFGIPMETALKAATINPARAAKIDNVVGSIVPGKYADLLVVDDDVNVEEIYLAGVRQ